MCSVHTGEESTCAGQVEILLSGLWDPSSGNLFAEEGDQQRFWKITRKFVEQMATVSGSRVKAVRPSTGTSLPIKHNILQASCFIRTTLLLRGVGTCHICLCWEFEGRDTRAAVPRHGCSSHVAQRMERL